MLGDPMKMQQRLSAQSGVGMIEVLVAMVLLAMGLLGAIALQFVSAKEQRSSQYVSRAAMAANEISERMRANREGILASLYVTTQVTYAEGLTASTMPTVNCTPAQPCTTPAQTTSFDVAVWQQNLQSNMPQGQSAAFLTMPADGALAASRDIVIAWVEPVVDKNADGNPILLTSLGTNPTSRCPASVKAPDGVRCYTQRFVL
jgi:type IV pilus assembly protein PilV